MNQEFAQTLFYGNAGLAPEEFTGLLGALLGTRPRRTART
jgi:hypothetical protein